MKKFLIFCSILITTLLVLSCENIIDSDDDKSPVIGIWEAYEIELEDGHQSITFDRYYNYSDLVEVGLVRVEGYGHYEIKGNTLTTTLTSLMHSNVSVTNTFTFRLANYGDSLYLRNEEGYITGYYKRELVPF